MKNMFKIKRFIKCYKNFSIILANFLVLFLIINLVIFGALYLRGERFTGSKIYGEDVLRKAYPDLSEEDRNILLDETWPQIQIYQPFTQFKEIPSKGKFVNINKNGFRVIENQCEYPISKENYNIFVFGGSTTFGYGVADSETIPSKIQKILSQENCPKICVYNFGRGYYYSSQERIFFETLLIENQIPDTVLFIEGLNDFYRVADEPEFTNKLANYMSNNKKYLIFLNSLPLMKTIYHFLPSNKMVFAEEDNVKDALRHVIGRIFENKKIVDALSKDFNINSYFVIQPVPTYRYNLSYHSISKENLDIFKSDPAIFGTEKNNSYWFHGYPLLEEYYNNLDKKDRENIIWLADMQLGRTENFYVDAVHYNSLISEEIALEISERIKPNICGK